MDASQILTGAGGTATILAIAYGVRLFIDWMRTDRETKHTATTAVVSSAETANAVILKSLEALERENGRLRGEIAALVAEAAQKDTKIRELESMLHQAQKQIEHIAAELTSMKVEQ